MDWLEENRLIWGRVRELQDTIVDAEGYFNFLKGCATEPEEDTIKKKANDVFIDMFHKSYMVYVNK